MDDVLSRLRPALAGRYTLERELGRGGMATVWLAHDLKHDRPVALKVLRPELAAALGSERFLREIKVTAQLTHPHILPLYDSGVAGGFLFYAMPYVEGESLRDRLNREKQLPLDDAVQIAREVADALSYAHSRDVVHRDIKPENILLESGHAVVADFGIARAITAAGGEKLTETGIAVGTPAYMSPEQAAGSKDLDGRSDLYSLGCVLYEMLAGQPPFTGPTVASLVHQHLAASPPNVTNIRRIVPAHIAATLQRALAKTPADRFNPVALFAEALGRPGSGAAPAPQPVPAVARWSWRRMALLGGAVVVVIAAAVAVSRWPRLGSAGSRHPRTSIAVLPFQNLSAKGPNTYFAVGLHDELITQLAKVAALKPISRTSVMEYATRTKPLRQIADELAVGTIISATVQVVGERLRLNVQLIDAATGQHLWAERYDRTLDDAFAVQSEIAQQIVTTVGASLGGTERAALVAAPTANAKAYRLYLQGLHFMRQETAMGFDSAAQYLKRAIAQDSSFAAAFAAISYVYHAIGGAVESTEDWFVKARASALRAVELDSSLAEAWWALSNMAYSRFTGFRHEESVRYLRKAISLNPGLSEAHEALAFVLLHVGMLDRAEQEVRITRSLDPLNVGAQFRLGQIALARGQYDIAAAELARVPTLWAKPYMAEALVGQGRLQEALDLLASLDTTHADARPLVIASIAAVARARVGDTVRAVEGIRRSMEGLAFFDHAHHVEYNIGAAYAIVGEHELALAWFRRAVAGGFPCLPAYERPAFLGSLRSDPRYAEFIRSLRKEHARLRQSIEALLAGAAEERHGGRGHGQPAPAPIPGDLLANHMNFSTSSRATANG